MSVNSSPTHQYVPIENPTASFWHTETDSFHDHRTTAELPASTDIVIIGAGYAGISVAYHLVKADDASRDISVTVLEARGLCSGATGRNGGHLRPDLYGHIPTYIDRFGIDAGLEIAEFEIAHVPAIKTLVETEKIDCDFAEFRTVDVWINEAAALRARDTYELMVSRKLEYMKDVTFVFGDGAEEASGIKGARACATYTAASIWPYKFISHLAKSAVETGQVNIQTHTAVTSVSPASGSDGGCLVTTARGTIRAKKVVYANNAYVGGLLPEYQKAIVPCKGLACHITAPESTKLPIKGKSYLVREEDSVLSYLISRPDGSIIVGGANSKYKPYLEQWYNNTDDGCLIKEVENHFDGYMQKFFLGWEDSKAKVNQIWTGVMGYSFDSTPQVGKVPGKADQYVLAGFNGHGMPIIWLTAKGIAKMVLGTEFKDTGMPRLYETTQERLDRIQKTPGTGDII